MLEGCRIFLVENEFMLAQEFQYELEAAGAVVLGPEPSVHRGLARMRDQLRIDAAVLDVNPDGERVLPVADALLARRVPFLFTSGYEDMVVLDRYHGMTKCDKPIDTRGLFKALDRLVASDRA